MYTLMTSTYYATYSTKLCRKYISYLYIFLILLKMMLNTHNHNSIKTTLHIFSDFSLQLQTYDAVSHYLVHAIVITLFKDEYFLFNIEHQLLKLSSFSLYGVQIK